MSHFSPSLLIFIPFKLLHKLMNLHIMEKDIFKGAICDFLLIRIQLKEEFYYVQSQQHHGIYSSDNDVTLIAFESPLPP